MTSLAKLPSEAWCKRFVYKQITGSNACQHCNGGLVFKRSCDYGWCSQCRVKVRPKATTWFRSSNLSYQQIFLLIWCWQQRQSPGTACLVAGVSYTTARRWYWRMRALLPRSSSKEQLSGIVEIDESFFGKQKYSNQKMVVGAIERDSRRLQLRIIEDREQDTLELFITDYVDRTSLICTDYHLGYNDLGFYGYTHERYNHSRGHFSQTNQIENMWGVMKRYLRKMYGCVPTNRLQLILNEWMARQNSKQLFVSPQNYLSFTLCSGLVD